MFSSGVAGKLKVFNDSGLQTSQQYLTAMYNC